MYWKQPFTLESINAISKDTLAEHLAIEFTDYGEDYLEARMPVDHRTVQPMGLLHGGASAALAESMGSVASVLCLENMDTHTVVGVEINANHLRSVNKGFVTARVTPLKVGRRMHVWQIKIKDEKDKLICVSRLTIAVVEKR